MNLFFLNQMSPVTRDVFMSFQLLKWNTPKATASHMNAAELTHDVSLSSSPALVRIIMNKQNFK